MRNAREQMVFIVDDDTAVRDSIQELVESVGLRVEGYASAFAFLDDFQPQYSGCLVLDVRMAAMSGLALQERLNELGFRIPVIMLTGHGDVPMAVQAMKAGAVDFIQKPTGTKPCWIASTPPWFWMPPPDTCPMRRSLSNTSLPP